MTSGHAVTEIVKKPQLLAKHAGNRLACSNKGKLELALLISPGIRSFTSARNNSSMLNNELKGDRSSCAKE